MSHNLQTLYLATTYFHGIPDMPCVMLYAPELKFSGLAAPPEDSLGVPRDGELLPPPPTTCPWFSLGADEGST